MASVVGIVNSALIKLGADRIISLSDDSVEARLASAQYEKLKDEVLRSHPWNFALARSRLGRLSSAPVFGYACQFALPSDCLRVLMLGDGHARYAIEGRRLLADRKEAEIVYIARVADPNLFDPQFRETLACRLAADLAYPLTNSSALATVMMRLYRDHLALARVIDGQEGGAVKSLESSPWVQARG